MQGQLRANLLKGLKLGLLVAIAMSAIATIMYVAFGAPPAKPGEPSFAALVAMYGTAGCVAGALVGLAWPLRRSLIGASILGVVGMFPFYMGAAMVNAGQLRLNSADVGLASFLALVVGVPVGVGTWLRGDSPRPAWFRALANPSAATTAAVIVIGLALAGSSLFLLAPRIANWPAFPVMLTFLAVFIGPLAVTVLVLVRFVRALGAG